MADIDDITTTKLEKEYKTRWFQYYNQRAEARRLLKVALPLASITVIGTFPTDKPNLALNFDISVPFPQNS